MHRFYWKRLILFTQKKRWNIWRYCIKVGHSGTFIWQLNVPLNAMVLDYLCLVWTSQKIDCSHGKSLSQGDFLGICLYACSSTQSSAVSATPIALMPMQCYVLSAFHTRIYNNRPTLWSTRLLHLTKEFLINLKNGKYESSLTDILVSSFLFHVV